MEENYYVLLDLDPKVNDEAKIKAAIKAKQLLWGKERNHPTRGTISQKYLAMISQIQSIMLTPELREAQAKEAEVLYRNARKQALQEVAEKIEFLGSEGFIYEKQLANLKKKYSRLSGPDIHSLIPNHVEIRASEKKKKKGCTPISELQSREIQSRLAIIKKDNLYDFLNVIPKTSIASLAERIKSKDTEIKSISRKSAEITAQGELIGLCRVHLGSEETKCKYDESLKLKVFDSIKGTLTLVGKGDTIYATQLETVLRQCMSKGISKTDAMDFIKSYAKDKSIYLEIGTYAGADFQACGYCGSLINVKDSNCGNCGCPTTIECPECSKENPSNLVACRSCGFLIGDIPNALTYLKQAQLYIREEKLEDARIALSTAKHYWPNYPGIRRVENELSEQKKNVDDFLKKLKTLVHKKYYYEAMDTLNSHRALLGNPAVTKLSKEIEARYKEAEKHVTNGLKKSLQAEKYESFSKALEIAEDCQQAKKELERIPPEPPTQITTLITGHQVELKWTPKLQLGEISYQLVRKKSKIPTNPGDGDLVYQGKATSCHDILTEPGIPYYYAIFSSRKGIFSVTQASSDHITLLKESEPVSIKKKENALLVEWKSPKMASQTQISYQPTSKDVALKTVKVKGDEYLINHLKNGQTYQVILRTIYKPFGTKEVLSPGVVIHSTPNPPPTGILNWDLEKKNDHIHCTWKPPFDGEVLLVVSPKSFSFEENDLLSGHELNLFKTRITPLKRGLAKVPIDFQGTRHIVPILLKNDYYVAGKSRSIEHLDEVKHLELEKVQHGIKITWNCHEGTPALVLEYGHNRGQLTHKKEIKNPAPCSSVILSHVDLSQDQFILKIATKAGTLLSPGRWSELTINKPKVMYDIVATRSGDRFSINVVIEVRGKTVSDLVLMQGRHALPLSVDGTNNIPLLIIKPGQIKRGRFQKSLQVEKYNARNSKLYFKLFTLGESGVDEPEILNNRKIIRI